MYERFLVRGEVGNVRLDKDGNCLESLLQHVTTPCLGRGKSTSTCILISVMHYFDCLIIWPQLDQVEQWYRVWILLNLLANCYMTLYIYTLWYNPYLKTKKWSKMSFTYLDFVLSSTICHVMIWYIITKINNNRETSIILWMGTS